MSKQKYTRYFSHIHAPILRPAHGIYPETEIIATNEINTAYENLTNGKAKFRYVVDMSKL